MLNKKLIMKKVKRINIKKSIKFIKLNILKMKKSKILIKSKIYKKIKNII
jgi:hypothetical protein